MQGTYKLGDASSGADAQPPCGSWWMLVGLSHVWGPCLPCGASHRVQVLQDCRCAAG